MDELSRCHKFALKEVLGAVGLLKSRSGASARDIYFVLDHLHGKVQRPVINYALKAAVNKGLLNCVNNHYKLRRRQGVRAHMSRGRTVHKTRSRASTKSVAARSRTRSVKARARRSRRDSLSEVDYSGSDYGVPVRNYECSSARRPKTRRSNSRRTYRFREVSSVESCSCAGCVDYSDTDVSSVYSDYSQYSSDPKPRKKAKKSKKKYPMPKRIKVEKKSSGECEMSADERKSTKSTSRRRKGKTSGNKGKSNAKGLEVASTGAGTASPTSQEPQAGSSRAANNNKYNLRPRGNKRVCHSRAGKKRGRKAQTQEASEQPVENSNESSNPQNN